MSIIRQLLQPSTLVVSDEFVATSAIGGNQASGGRHSEDSTPSNAYHGVSFGGVISRVYRADVEGQAGEKMAEVEVSAVPTSQPTKGGCNCAGYAEQLSRLVTTLEAAQRSKESDDFYRNVGTVAVLGASISFTLIVSDLKDPKEVSWHGKFDLSTVRVFLAISWLLFMASLNLSFSYAQLRPRKMLPSKFVYVVSIAAVLFLALVISAYVEVVGYVGVAMVCYVAIQVLIGALRGR